MKHASSRIWLNFNLLFSIHHWRLKNCLVWYTTRLSSKLSENEWDVIANKVKLKSVTNSFLFVFFQFRDFSMDTRWVFSPSSTICCPQWASISNLYARVLDLNNQSRSREKQYKHFSGQRKLWGHSIFQRWEDSQQRTLSGFSTQFRRSLTWLWRRIRQLLGKLFVMQDEDIQFRRHGKVLRHGPFKLQPGYLALSPMRR